MKEVLEVLVPDPWKKSKGLHGDLDVFRKFRWTRRYRVIFEIDDAKRAIGLLDTDHRGSSNLY